MQFLLAFIPIMAFSAAVVAQSSSATATAPAATKTIVVTVGLNTTNNASAVFQPGNIKANLGDTVLFNFTQGNHTATQSTFDVPCIPAHDTNITINGFNSGVRIQANDTSSILAVPILPENVNMTMWFFDANTCGKGGVGVINANDSSTSTYDGFVRNAIRLFGTGSSSTTSSSASRTSGGTGASSTPTSGAERNIISASVGVVILTLAWFTLFV